MKKSFLFTLLLASTIFAFRPKNESRYFLVGYNADGVITGCTYWTTSYFTRDSAVIVIKRGLKEKGYPNAKKIVITGMFEFGSETEMKRFDPQHLR